MVHILQGAKKLPTKAELLYDPKIRDSFSLGNSIQSLRKTKPGIKIGFANGTFKVLTPAHCVFLTLCRTKCDLLVVGVNSDYSLRLNGKKSPFDAKERAFALASLHPVDYVSIFDEETPALCIANIDADLVFKGPDYKKDEVVAAGKEVEIIEHPFNIHTSDIMDTKIKESSGKYKYFDV